MKRKNPGYVYLAHFEQGYVIEHCSHIYNRPDVICWIETRNMLKLKHILCVHFQKKCMNGEWFDLSENDVEYIKSLAEKFNE